MSSRRRLALFALAGVLAAAALPPFLALQARSDALTERAEAEAQLDRLMSAERRAAAKTKGLAEIGQAPPEAFLNAQTPGLATAQLEAHVSDLAATVRANLVSSAAQQQDRSDEPGAIRIQANVDLDYDALQALLYELEAGAPYIFVESMTVRPAGASSVGRAGPGLMRASLGLKALWRAGST